MGRLGIFERRPSGSFFGRGGGAHLGHRGGEGVGPGAEAGGGELGGEFFEGAGVFLVREAGAVVVARRKDARLKEILLAGKIESGKLSGGAGLVETGGENGELGRAGAFLRVGETGLGGADLVGGLALGGELVGVFQRKKARAGGDAGAFGDRKFFELAAKRGADVNELAFEVTLIAERLRAGAGGEAEAGGAENQ